MLSFVQFRRYYKVRGVNVKLFKKIFIFIFTTGLMSLFFSNYVYAQSQVSDSSPSAVPAGALLVALICYWRSKRAIGGWLLYYYISLYLGSLFGFIITIAFISNLNPQGWNVLPYILYLTSIIPGLIATIVEVIVASLLLKKSYRKKSNVKLLRYIFIIEIIANTISLGIDSIYWKASIVFDVLALVWSVVWYNYFTYSLRVSFVLEDNKWNYANFKSAKKAIKPL